MKKIYVSLLLAMMLLLTGCKGAKAQINVPGALDRILSYEITAEVNEDATVFFHYHILWEVLDSASEGPLEWVKIGVPNATVDCIVPLSDDVQDAYYYSSGGSYIRVDLVKSFYAGEVADIEFSFISDNLYEMNALTDGETVYYFTPGWFDGMAVDKLTIRWADEYSIGWSSGAYQDGGYIVWEEVDVVGRTDERSITYLSDTFAFDDSKTYDGSLDYYDYYNNYQSNSYYNYNSESDDGEAVAMAGIVFLILIFTIIRVAISSATSYDSGSGFSSEPKVTRKVTRTLIKYYPTCPGCGATRAENQEKCEYCGRSFIESEEVVEEKEIKEPSRYNEEGIFSYGSTPNTYIRVHVTHVPAPRPKHTCVHSSCACAHSCACACACACAGGGRAGCSTKDFYNTGLKLKQFEKRKKH